MKKDEITTEGLENRTEDVPKIAEMNVLNATIVEMTIATVATGNVQNATTPILLLEPNATDVENLVDNTRMVEATTGVEDSSVTIEVDDSSATTGVEDSSATTEAVETATEAIGNVPNAATPILLLEPNATDVENHVDGTRMEEATTEVDDSSVTKEEVRLEIIEVVTKVAGEKFSMTTIGNAQNAKTQILLLEPNATDVESHETVETHVGKEGIRTEDTHTLLANQTKGHLAERVSAHLVEMDATVEMSGIMTTETTTMVLGIMNDHHLENRENRGHLENHVAMDPAMHIIVRQNH